MKYFRGKLKHTLLTLSYMGSMMGLFSLMGYMLWGWFGLVLASLSGVIIAVMNAGISTEQAMKWYGARRMGPHEAGELMAVLNTVARKAGLHRVPDLYYSPSLSMNAFTAVSGDDSAIALTDGLLRNLNAREMTGVLAHEVAHIAHNDVWIMRMAHGMGRLTGYMSLFGQLMIIMSLPFMISAGPDAALNAAAVFLLMLLAPGTSRLLHMALARTREFDADMTSARITGNPMWLASALRTIQERHRSLWYRIVFPLSSGKNDSMLNSHPDPEKRIARLAGLRGDERIYEVKRKGDFITVSPGDSNGLRGL